MVVIELANFITQIIASSGYFGVFFLMMLESAVVPIPSEIVMPFAGFIASTGGFNIWLVVLAGTVGNLVGSLVAYFVGLYLGRGFIFRYGKYVLLEKKYLLMTEKWFKKKGDKTIFFSRLLPVIRTVISLPAGIGRMNLGKFMAYTFVGSIPWNVAQTYIGVILGKNWNLISRYSDVIDILLGILIVAFVIWFVLKHRKKE
jgi:membrane protein DedA with SNARE-associated domain